MTTITLPRATVEQALAFTMRDFTSLRDFEAARAVLHDNLRAALAQQAEPVQEPVACCNLEERKALSSVKLPCDVRIGHGTHRKGSSLLALVVRSRSLYQMAKSDDYYGYASRLAVALWEKHYKDIAPQWKPLDDLMGVLTQIDNMASGLTRLAQQAEQAWVCPESPEHRYTKPGHCEDCGKTLVLAQHAEPVEGQSIVEKFNAAFSRHEATRGDAVLIERRDGRLYMNDSEIGPGTLEIREDGVTYRSAALVDVRKPEQAEPDHETRAELAEQQVVQLAEERDHYRNLWQKAQQAEPVEPVDVGLLEYRGNSVAFIHQKMTAYRTGIDAAWDALRANGLHPDGKTSLADMIAKYTAPPQRKPLTEEEFDALCKANSFGAVARNQFPLIPRAMLKALVDAAVERALEEKNRGR